MHSSEKQPNSSDSIQEGRGQVSSAGNGGRGKKALQEKDGPGFWLLWMGATAGGMVLGLAAVVLLYSIFPSDPDSSLMAAVMGGMVGLAQWFVLRPYRAWAVWWAAMGALVSWAAYKVLQSVDPAGYLSLMFWPIVGAALGPYLIRRSQPEAASAAVNSPQFRSLIPGRVVGALVFMGATAMLIGFSGYKWISVPNFYYRNATGSVVAYGWWKYLLPVVAFLTLSVLASLSVGAVFFAMPWRRGFWVGLAIAGLISLYPFYRLVTPGDLPIAAIGPEQRWPDLWIHTPSIGGAADSGFWIALGGTLLLTVGALSGVIGRRLRATTPKRSKSCRRS